MSRYDQDQDLYDRDDDKRFYEKTAYNEEYYIEREQSRSGSRTSILSLRRLKKDISGRCVKKAYGIPSSSSLERASPRPNPNQFRRSVNKGKADLPAVPRAQDVGKLENRPYIHQRSAQDFLTFSCRALQWPPIRQARNKYESTCLGEDLIKGSRKA